MAMEDGLAAALRATPRLIGKIELTAYDYALRRLMVMQHVRFTGVPPIEPLEAGLLRALQQYPVLLGQLQHPCNSTAAVCWDSHGQRHALGFHWSTAVKPGKPPNLWSNWDIWRSGAALPLFGYTAAAKLTIYPDANESILIFAFDHALFDYPTGYKFLHKWFAEATASASAAAPLPAVPTPSAVVTPQLVKFLPLHLFSYLSAAAAKTGITAAFATKTGRAVSSDQLPSSNVSVDAVITLAPSKAKPLGAALPRGEKTSAGKLLCADGYTGSDSPTAATAIFINITNSSSSSSSSSDGIQLSNSSDFGPECIIAAQITDPAAAAAAAAASNNSLVSLDKYSRDCYHSCPTWKLPGSCSSGSGSSSGSGNSSQCTKQLQQQQRQQRHLVLRQAYRQWLEEHSGTSCPFPWEPLSRAGACRMTWKLVIACMMSRLSAWRIPRKLLDHWKDAAAAECPLPDGDWYSANTAATALFVATLYQAAPEKATTNGGLYVAVVVDARGGRCGMSIPKDSASNASVWGIRTWVPLELLAAAQGTPTPALMYCLRNALNRQLRDAYGSINRQFEWWEAVQHAGLCDKAALLQGLQQVEDGDVCVDWLTTSASDLPTLPGTSVSAASVRWLPSYFERMVMASPVPPDAAAARDSSSSSSSSSGFDVQFEITLPTKVLRRVAPVWTQLGLTQMTVPADELHYWQLLDALVYPCCVLKLARDMVGGLPALLVHFVWSCFVGICTFLQRVIQGVEPEKKVVGMARGTSDASSVLSLAVVAISLASLSAAAAWTP